MANDQGNRGQGRSGDNQKTAGGRPNDMGRSTGTTGGNREQGRGSSRRGDETGNETGNEGSGRGSQGTRKK